MKGSSSEPEIKKIMKQEIDIVRKEFMGVLKDITNKSEENSILNEKNSKLDFSGTGQSYFLAKGKPEQLTFDENYSKMCIDNQSSRKDSSFVRSSSAQNNHKNLFYKHAFNEKENKFNFQESNETEDKNPDVP